MSSSVPQTQNLLNRCVTALTWANMTFCAPKSRSIVIHKGKVLKLSPFIVSSTSKGNTEVIPSIHLNPVKFLGRTISSSLFDSDVVTTFINQTMDNLKAINSSPHRGIHKVWFLHHLLIPRARWPLLIYEVSLSTVLKLEQTISSFIRKWLRLHSLDHQHLPLFIFFAMSSAFKEPIFYPQSI